MATATQNFDVVVVGGGLAGLSAARMLIQHGLAVVLLEARDRVGGRTHSIRVDSGHTIDLGAQFIGDVQPTVSALVDEAGLTRVPVYFEGKKLRASTPQASPATQPQESLPLSIFGQLDAAQMQFRWEREMKNLDKPEVIAKLDNRTWAEHVRQTTFFQKTRDFMGEVMSQLCMAEDVSAYEVLDQARSMGGMENDWKANEYFLKEGTNALADFLATKVGDEALRLGQPVTSIQQDDIGVTVQTAGGVFCAKKAVVAVPPQLYAATGVLSLLPEPRRQAVSAFRQGKVIKTVLVFATPWWRDAGLSGTVECPASDFPEIFDVSPADSSAGILVSFSTGATAERLHNTSEEERVRRVLRQLEALHRRSIPQPIASRSVDWSAAEWSLGGYASRRAPGCWSSKEGGAALFAPCGNVHFAGTETASQWRSYMEGALSSGQRAATEIAKQLGVGKEETN